MSKEFHQYREEYEAKKRSMSDEEHTIYVSKEKAEFEAVRGDQNYADHSDQQMSANTRLREIVQGVQERMHFAEASIFSLLLTD